MDTITIKTTATPIPANVADVTTPVSLYLKLRDAYPNTILLESSDYHGSSNSMSFICFKPLYEFVADKGQVLQGEAHKELQPISITKENNVPELLDAFIKSFEVDNANCPVKVNGLFGYSTFDAVQYFDSLNFSAEKKEEHSIPELRYAFYKYIIAFNHFTNQLHLIENLQEGEESQSNALIDQFYNRSIPTFQFQPSNNEKSNLTDEEYMNMVTKGKEHCFRGDVFQIVLSRQFRQQFSGDEFNVYRALRNINPSPYLFYFDYGSYKIFGSSPEAQLIIENNVATINPIAGTFKRTGDDTKDQELAIQLSKDEKENAEHVMLVDLARNDLSRNCQDVTVNTYKEVQYYSHVLHLVSDVSGKLQKGSIASRVMADTFPAGTLSGAPKYKAMQLIDSIENQNRSYYGGCIGNIGLDGSFNQAIMIRSFLSKNNTLFYQAGAGVVSESKEENELNEVNNKLGALKKAIHMAEEF
ncbi:anthranilate synthase component I family protein [Carboxylicivirga sp. M1479]|uniref:anthranilate synthase component I family protein n=1 Tax=Carboxylicivirga sp. M1479 TaxID=2594476 RepID=UPI001177CE22|nr:anthranilate synthase component I family protein [Carboxylicivirga sp. M1479]TRX72325.1 anthranilate synthase component I family protein [Carboxylicivirga sp. M1479]